MVSAHRRVCGWVWWCLHIEGCVEGCGGVYIHIEGCVDGCGGVDT